jgi:hypothetical protein
MIKELKPFVGKIITFGRNCPGPEYANDFLFPDGIRKQVAYVDTQGHLNYVSGLCEDNSPCFMCGLSGMDEADIKKNYNITFIREVNEDELDVYIKEVDSYFSAIMKEKNRPPFAKFPLPIIDKVKMTAKWKKVLIEEQNL